MRHAARPDATAERPGPGDQHAGQIGHGGASQEQAARILREAEQLDHTAQHLPLHLDRDMVAATQIGIEPRREHFRQHPDGRPPAMHPAHEAGMRIADRKRQDTVHEGLVNLVQPASLPGQGLAKAPAHRVGNRLPDRPLANALEIIQHIVEHAVALRPEPAPVDGVETGGDWLPAALVGWC